MEIDTAKLLRLRQERAWSQSQLASIAGISTKTVRRAERGAASSLETARALASAFKLDVSEIYKSEIVPPSRTEADLRLLGQYGPLLAAISDALSENNHWRQQFGDLFQFRSFFHREPSPTLSAALETSQHLASTVSLQLHRDLADAIGSLKRMQRLIAGTCGFMRSAASHGYHIPQDVQTEVRIEGHAECDHVDFFLGRAKRELVNRAYPNGSA